MAITIQYTDDGEEKIIGSDGQETEDIKIQWRQHRIDADVLKRIQREPKVFTQNKVAPEDIETENFVGSINNNGSSLFTIKGDSALLSFTIIDDNGDSYPIDDKHITWFINGNSLSVKNNVYELSEQQLIDREVNIIKAEYDDGEIKVSDDINILKFIGYDNISVDGEDERDNPNVVGGMLRGNSNVEIIAPNGFIVGKEITLYYKKPSKVIRWDIKDGTGVKKGNGIKWRPKISGIVNIDLVAYSNTFDLLDTGEINLAVKINPSSSGRNVVRI